MDGSTMQPRHAATAPIQDVVATDQAVREAPPMPDMSGPALIEQDIQKPSPTPPSAAKPPKSEQVVRPPKPRQPVVAITATVVIVLGLGVLITYAYLRSSGVAVS